MTVDGCTSDIGDSDWLPESSIADTPSQFDALPDAVHPLDEEDLVSTSLPSCPAFLVDSNICFVRGTAAMSTDEGDEALVRMSIKSQDA